MKNRYVLLIDFFALIVAACGAFIFRFDWLFFATRPEFLPFIALAPAVQVLTLHAFGMYRRFWRYATTDDIVALGVAVSIASLPIAIAAYGAIFVFHVIREFSRTVLVAHWLLSLGAVAAVRLSIRVAGESYVRPHPAADRKRVLIAGAGAAGVLVAREVKRNPRLRLDPVGFLDDDHVKIGKRIAGIPVLGSLTQLDGVVRSHAVDQVVICIPTASGTVLRTIAETCRVAGVESRTVPGVFELLDGQVNTSRLRQVDITDLLRRTPMRSSPESADFLRNRVVLVTGAGGSIGAELCRQIAHAGAKRMLLVGHGENSIFEAHLHLRAAYPAVEISPIIADIRDRDRLFQLFDRLRPEVVFHAAAHKHVPLMEQNAEEAITNNVLGTRNIVDAAVRVNVQRLVLVSTDKAVSPSSLMGASKRVAEWIVLTTARRMDKAFVVVRFGNVLGSRGSVVPIFKRQIEAGGPVYVTDPAMTRFFMTIPEAVHLVLQAAGMGCGGELLVLRMGEPLRILDLVHDLVRLSGLASKDIPVVFTGLRPGEKLHESLWEPGAGIHDTSHPDVLEVTEALQMEYSECVTLVDALCKAARQGDRTAIIRALTEVIPTYTPFEHVGTDAATDSATVAH